MKRITSVFLILILLLSTASLIACAELKRSNDRSDYPALSDADFANFRMVATSGIYPGKLYRSSSPINPKLGRNTYADSELAKAGIANIINLADNEDEAHSYKGFLETNYASVPAIFLDMNTEFSTDENKAAIVRMIRYIGEYSGPYLIHCNEGKTRTGFACMILECLMGATPQEVLDDCMKTYENFYGITPGSKDYTEISEKQYDTLYRLCGNTQPTTEKLTSAAYDYLISIGCTDTEIQDAKDRLSMP